MQRQQKTTCVSYPLLPFLTRLLGNLKKDEQTNEQKKFQSTFSLKDAIEKQRKALENERDSDKNIYVSRQLMQFIETDVYFKFLNSLLEYCSELFRLENKQ